MDIISREKAGEWSVKDIKIIGTRFLLILKRNTKSVDNRNEVVCGEERKFGQEMLQGNSPLRLSSNSGDFMKSHRVEPVSSYSVF